MTIEVTNGASITSKAPSRMLTGLRSLRTNGMYVQLEDGRWYTDWQAGLHGILYGAAPNWWRDAMQSAVQRGPASSITCADERIVAELLGTFYPDIKAVRFLANGSDPCAAAVKIARAYTGHDKLLTYGYHGTCSAYAAPPTPFDPDDNRRGTLAAERDAYVPLEWEGHKTIFDDLESKMDNSIAAIIVECPPIDGENAAGFLWACANIAHDCGALFVLDEVVTAFRYGPGGAAEYYGLHGLVDLYCFGKTLGNGYPVAALAGKKEYMDELAGRPGQGGKVHWSGTWAGEPLGMAAAKATLRRLLEEPPWEHLYAIGEYLKGRWNDLGLPWQLVGHPTRPVLEAAPCPPDDAYQARQDLTDLRRFLFQHGHIVCMHPWYVTMATTREDVDALVSAAGEWEV